MTSPITPSPWGPQTPFFPLKKKDEETPTPPVKVKSAEPDVAIPKRILTQQQIEQQEKLAKLNLSSPPPSMSHKLAAHFLGGPMVEGMCMGRASLERENFGKMTLYYRHLMEEVAKESGVIHNQAFSSAITGINQCLHVFKVAEHLKSSVKDWPNRAQAFSFWIGTQLDQMAPGETFLIPGGWEGVGGKSGHAMLYELSKEKEGNFTLKIYNTGSGLEFHPTATSDAHSLHAEVLMKTGIDPKRITNPTFWGVYFETLLDPINANLQPTAYEVYRLFDLIEDGFVEKAVKQTADSMRGKKLRRGQRIGNCTGEVLRLYMKTKLEEKPSSEETPLYQHLRDQMLMKVVHAYTQFLTQEGSLPSDEASGLFVVSPKNASSLLSVLGLFEAEIDTVRRSLLRALKKNRKGKHLADIQQIETQVTELRQLQRRADRSREACQIALKEKMERPPLTQETGVSCALSTPSTFPQVKLEADMSLTGAPIPKLNTWPTTAKELAGQLEDWLKLLASTDSVYGKQKLLREIFQQMPAVNNRLWEGEGIASQIEPLAKLSRLYIRNCEKANCFTASEALALQKSLAVLVLLGKKHDPILSKNPISSIYRKLFKELDPLLTAVTPQERADAVETDQFLKNSLSDNHGLFYELGFREYQEEYAIFTSGDPPSKILSGGLKPEYVYIFLDDHPEFKEGLKKKLTESGQFTKISDALLVAGLLADHFVDFGYRLPTSFLAVRDFFADLTSFVQVGAFCETNPFSFREEGDSYILSYPRPREKGSVPLKLLTQAYQASKEEIEALFFRRVGIFSLYEKESSTFMRQIDKFLVDQDPHHQIIHLLRFFTQHAHLLQHTLYRNFLLTYLFKLDATTKESFLVTLLKHHPQNAHLLATFIQTGYDNSKRSLQKKDTPFQIEESLFYLTIASYCAPFAPTESRKEFTNVLMELEDLWKNSQGKSSSVNNKTLRIRIAQEALNFCGRGGEITAEHLPQLLAYRHFLAQFNLLKDNEQRWPPDAIVAGSEAISRLCELQPKKTLDRMVSTLVDLPSTTIWDWSHFPIGATGRYQLDLSSGKSYLNGLSFSNELPPSLLQNSTFRTLFQNYHECLEIRVQETAKQVITTFRDSHGRAYRIEGIKRSPDTFYIIYKEIHGRWCAHYVDDTDTLDHIRHPGEKGWSCWSDPIEKNIWIVDPKGETTFAYNFTTRLLTEVGKTPPLTAIDMEDERSVHTYRLFLAFDPLIQVWKNQETFSPVKITSSTFGLTFEVDAEKRIWGTGAWKGFEVIADQYLPSLPDIEGKIVLYNSKTKETVLLLPAYEPQSSPDLLQSVDFPHKESVKYYSFQVTRRGNVLTGKERADHLYLAHLFFQMRHMDHAYALLQKCGGSDPYTGEELKWILASLTQSKHKGPQAIALRLKLAVLLLSNFAPTSKGSIEPETSAERELVNKEKEKWAHFKTASLASDYLAYLDLVTHTPERWRLSMQEEDLLLKELSLWDSRLNQRALQLHPDQALVQAKNSPTFFSHSAVMYSTKNIPLTLTDLEGWVNNKQKQNLEKLLSEAWSYPVSKKATYLFALDCYAIARDPSNSLETQKLRAALKVWLTRMLPYLKKQESVTPSVVEVYPFALFFLKMLNSSPEVINQLPNVESLCETMQSENLPEKRKLFDLFRLVENQPSLGGLPDDHLPFGDLALWEFDKKPQNFDALIRGEWPVRIHKRTAGEYALSCYSIARDPSNSPKAQELRAALKSWLTAVFICSKSDEHKTPIFKRVDLFALFFLKMLNLPAEVVNDLPTVESLLTTMSGQDLEAQKSLFKKFDWMQSQPLSVGQPGSLSPSPYEKPLKKSRHLRTEKLEETLLLAQQAPVLANKHSENLENLDKSERNIPLLEGATTLFKPVVKQPKLPSAAKMKPLNPETTDRFYQSSFASLQKGEEQYLSQLQQKPTWKIESTDLASLQKSLSEEVVKTKQAFRANRKKLLEKANQLPTASLGKLTQTLETHLQLRSTLRWEDLLFLYGKGNLSAYLRRNPALSEEQAQEIYEETATLLVTGIRLQKRERALQLISQIQTKSTDSDIGTLRALLKSERSYSLCTFPAALLFEFATKMQLRPDQIANLEKLGNPEEDWLVEAIMGSGKTEVLIRLFAQQHADGEHLPMVVMLKEHISSAGTRMEQQLLRLFNQDSHQINWEAAISKHGEDVSAALARLEAIYHKLEAITQVRAVLRVYPEQLHSFFLEERVTMERYMRIGDPMDGNRLEWFRKIRTFLETKGVALFDEAHLQLSRKRESQTPLGGVIKAPPKQLKISSDLVLLLQTNPAIQQRFYFEFSKKRQKSAEPFIPAIHQREFTSLLAAAWMASSSFAKLAVPKGGMEEEAILKFLNAPRGSPLSLPATLSKEVQRQIAYARGQIQIILPSTLSRRIGEHYGCFPAEKPGGEASLLAGPYEGADAPLYGSKFANMDEIAAFTLQTYHYTGIPPQALAKVFRTLHENAENEVTLSRGLKTYQKTKSYHEYLRLIGGEREKAAFPTLDQEPTSDEFVVMAAKLSQDPKRVAYFVERHILKEIEENEYLVTSNGLSLVRMVKCAKAVSGTFPEARTLHPRFQLSLDQTIAPKALVLMNKHPHVTRIPSDITGLAILDRLFPHSEKNVPRTLIDQGALLKGTKEDAIAVKLLSLTQGTHPPIERIIYFRNNILTSLRRGALSPEACLPESYDRSTSFVYIDSAHATGADIPQDQGTTAYVTANNTNTLSEQMQAAFRMRGIENQGQSVKFVISEELAEIIESYDPSTQEKILAEDLFRYGLHIQATDVQEGNYKAVFEKNKELFLHFCEQLLRSIPIESLRLEAFQELHRMTLKKTKEDPLVTYGQTERVVAPEVLFNAQKDDLIRQLHQWASTYQTNLSSYPFTQGVQALDQQMDKIIAQAVDPTERMVPDLVKSSTVSLDSHVQQTQQQQTQSSQNVTEHTFQNRDLTKQKVKPRQGMSHGQAFQTSHLQKLSSSPNVQDSIQLASPQKALKDLVVSLQSSQPKVADALNGLAESLHPQTLFSKKCIYSLNNSVPFKEFHQATEVVLLVQKETEMNSPYVIILSKTESENWLLEMRAGFQAEGCRCSLFYPVLDAYLEGTGVYQEGKPPFVFPPQSTEKEPLTPFEQHLTQTKFMMGTPDAYTPKEVTYLKQFLSQQKDLEACEQIFKDYFLPGTDESYEGSLLESVFKELRSHPPASAQPRPISPVITETELPSGVKLPTTSLNTSKTQPMPVPPVPTKVEAPPPAKPPIVSLGTTKTDPLSTPISSVPPKVETPPAKPSTAPLSITDTKPTTQKPISPPTHPVLNFLKKSLYFLFAPIIFPARFLYWLFSKFFNFIVSLFSSNEKN